MPTPWPWPTSTTGPPACPSTSGRTSGSRASPGGRPGRASFLGFQRVEGYRPPSWPGQDVPQQLHLDFAVDDLDEAAARLVALGATVPADQPRPDLWRVVLDPAGHPFCLTIPRTA